MNNYFNMDQTIYDIAQKHPEIIDMLVLAGFENMKNTKQVEKLGKSVSLAMALTSKKVNKETFEQNLVEAIENSQETQKLENNSQGKDIDTRIEGVLPCPVKVPLLDAFEKWLTDTDTDIKISYELKSASMGVNWLIDAIRNADSDDVLADLFISAGFDLFFDKQLIGKFKERGIFEDFTNISHYNKDFENETISLKDPDGQYSMIGVVPAVFLVNSEELGDIKIPTSWQDILSEDFENSVSLPIGDFDLFNAILLNIYKSFGETGIQKLGRSLLSSMHPSEMVKSHMKASKPKVTIMPYFFTKATKGGGPMIAVWPEDGAIISPIFMLSKKQKKEKLQPIVDFFASKEVGEILSHNGKFPSINPNVDNMIPPENTYMWVGWDFINEHDISELIKKCEKIFNAAITNEE